MRTCLFTALPLALVACGPAAPGGNDIAASGPTTVPQDGAFVAGWDVRDACKILPKEQVGRVLGAFVEHTENQVGSELADGRAGFSTCYYVLPEDKRVALLARMSPEDDNTPEAMKRTRDEAAEALGGAEDVPDLGKSAFWLPKMRQLNVFVGGNRYMNLTLPKGVDDATAKAQAIKLAHAVL